jgi:coenzyme F420-0:L-glutamate ligase/coenzyme F420-1:gamma-L-glutamate ligase
MFLSNSVSSISFFAVPDFPEIAPGDNLDEIVVKALTACGYQYHERDVFIFSQKIISKSENRYVDLDTVTPSPRARDFAVKTGIDPILVEVILEQSRKILKYREGLIIAEHKNGFVMANAGIDRSNLGHDRENCVLLLPEDPDASCARLKQKLDSRYGIDSSVMICDSVGRPWRVGTVGIALGCAGIPGTIDLRGKPDLRGRELKTSEVGYADQIAAAASLIMGEVDEGQPFVIARGLNWEAPNQPAKQILRSPENDLFI